MAAQAETDGAEERAVRERLVAAGIETAWAHAPGAPPVPGVHTGPGGGFAQGQPLDSAEPTPTLAALADRASGDARLFADVSDDELCGLLGARQRLEARQAWEKLMALAEFIRRRPAPGCRLRGPGTMPQVWAEGTAGEVSVQLAITQRAATDLLALAWDLAAKLPLTSEKLSVGAIDLDKTHTIASYCANLTLDEAREAEDILFSQPDIETMTWTMIRDRIRKAVIEVNPDAARKRREDAAKECRIEVRPEESGNAMIAGRELPAVAVLKMDQAINTRARQLRKLGVAGGINELRVLAFLERWGAADPIGALTDQGTYGEDRDRNDQHADDPGHGDGDAGDPDGNAGDPDGDSEDGDEDGGGGGRGPHGPEDGGPNPPGGAGSGCACGAGQGSAGPGGAGQGGAGLAAVLHLTAPAVTLTEMAQRPGVLRGAGPIDPDQVRDMADEAARNPETTYEFTLTDRDGRPVAHGCGKPGPNDRSGPGNPIRPRHQPGTPELTLIDRGPPGSYGRWRFTHGFREIIFEMEDLTGECDHRHQARGHDPGKHLHHLTGVLHQECTFLTCRTPEHLADYEHSKPYDDGGITCLCACGPVCRRNHRNKQEDGWKIDATGTPGWFRWTMPSGRRFVSKPTVYPI